MKQYVGIASYFVTRIASEGLRDVLNLVANATLARVSQRSALRHYRRAGHDLSDITEARSLDVAIADSLVPRVRRRWVAISGTAGIVTASTGLAGLIADIPTLIANSLMAIGEVGSLYGFDVSTRYEQAFAVAILFTRNHEGISTAESVERLDLLAGELQRDIGSPGEDHAQGRDWLSEASRELTWYLVKRQMASAIPGIGSLVSGGVNAQFTSHTCRRARRVYHERAVAEYAPAGRTASQPQEAEADTGVRA